MRELSLHILDLVQNSLTAGAQQIAINIVEDRPADKMVIRIEDDGCGIPADMIERVMDPFVTSRTTRRVGLGLPLFAQHAQSCGGDLNIRSTLAQGTTVEAEFQLSHIDRVPLGNIVDTLTMLVMCNPHVDFIYSHHCGLHRVNLDTRQIREQLGSEIPLSDPAVVQWIREFLSESEKKLAEV